jgi:HAD superfamily hydrolase (TIGR01549 family)
MIKLIIFDLWRTLIPATIDFDHLFSLIKKTGMSKEEFIEKYERSVQLKKYSNITELKKDFFLAFRDVDDIILAKEFYEIYNNRFDKISFFDDVEKNLLKFKKNYKLALLSNTESLTIKDIEKKLSLKDYFDFLGYSFNIGAIKPDKKMFETVLKKFNVLPEEAVMVGDSLRSDIIGAKKLNINTILINRDKIKLDNTSEKADFVIKSFDELEKKLRLFNEKKS